jgi:hypothetical protein
MVKGDYRRRPKISVYITFKQAAIYKIQKNAFVLALPCFYICTFYDELYLQVPVLFNLPGIVVTNKNNASNC